MNGVQCDTCRVFAAVPPPPGWLVLLEQQAAAESLFGLISGSGGTEPKGTFCSVRCLADYAIARAAVEGPATGARRQPGAEGWLG